MNYFDYAAATPVDSRVLDVMVPYFTDTFYNPSSVYLVSRGVKEDIAEARVTVAHWLGSKPTEVIFTAGATEANNLVVKGIQQMYPRSSIAISSVEHEAVIEPASKGSTITLPVNKYGQIEVSTISTAITDDTVLISVLYANNEIGTTQHMKDISSAIEEVKLDRSKRGIGLPLYFHTDASQAPNYLDLHVSKLGVDFMTLNGGKIYGPKQSGALYIHSGISIPALIEGGGQEKGLRSGTENVAGIIGFAKALDIAQKKRKDETHRLSLLRKQIISKLKNIDGVEIIGHQKQTLPNLISCLISGIDGERLVMMLDEKGFQVSTGSACSALRSESSHVIKALGYSEEEAQTSLRISMGRPTTKQSVDELVQILPDSIKAAREF